MKKIVIIVMASIALGSVNAVPPRTGMIGMPNPMPLKQLIDKFVNGNLDPAVIQCMKAYKDNFERLGRQLLSGIRALENQNMSNALTAFHQAYATLSGTDNSILLQAIKAECPHVERDVDVMRAWLRYLENQLVFIVNQPIDDQEALINQLMVLFQFNRVQAALERVLTVEQIEQDIEDLENQQDRDPHIIGTPVGTPVAVDGDGIRFPEE